MGRVVCTSADLKTEIVTHFFSVFRVLLNEMVGDVFHTVTERS